MRRTLIASVATAFAVTAAGAWAAVGEAGDAGDRSETGRPYHSARVELVRLHDAEGERVGKVWLRQKGPYVHVWANLHSLPPGFHGFHVHGTGVCDPDAPDGPFTSADGHYNPGSTPEDPIWHGEHAGDLPSLYVNANGWARLGFVTDAFTLAELRDADGSAVMVHAGRDNFANIPAERYASVVEGEDVPDGMTRSTGDAGSRHACGVVD
jgi:superoxide dismutase, Cu-Zn family